MNLRRLLILAIALAAASLSFAESVSRKDAQRFASDFFNEAFGRVMATPKFVYNGKKLAFDRLFTPFYVFNNPSGGFVVISADDKAYPVLGYDLVDSFNPDAIGTEMKALLSGYAQEIEQIRLDDRVPEEAVKAWRYRPQYIAAVLRQSPRINIKDLPAENAKTEIYALAGSYDADNYMSDIYTPSQWSDVIKSELGSRGNVPLGFPAYKNFPTTVIYGNKGDYFRIALDGTNNSFFRLNATEFITSPQIAMVGNSVQFANGSMFQIINVSDDGDCISIDLNAERMLTESKYGELTEVIFYDQNMVQLPNGILTAYPSQYGLQGKIFKHLARHMEYEGAAENLKLICSMAAAVVFVLIVFLLSKRYNRVLGGVFFVTFLLSPWIVNFASNLYWVEFTWFLPMVIGLFCAWKVDNKYCRIFSYVAAFVAVTVKCLCGYEYITSVMMGLILFLLSDFVMACIKGDRKQQFLLFRTIFILGILALAGFITAICIHAPLRGNGSIAKGIKSIFIDDVLRRTTGADLNHYTEDYVVALGASVWETVCKYFHFNTQIITGIDGNLFPLLCIIPVLIFIIGLRRKSLDFEFVALYIVTFLTSVSWFVLAKSHSYVHTHINFVLWYMGYVQVCLYVIVDWIIDRIGVRREYYE